MAQQRLCPFRTEQGCLLSSGPPQSWSSRAVPLLDQLGPESALLAEEEVS
ncbi:hypothetical protein NHG22_33635 [Streptomyces sp. ATE26]|nr:hypothetical protein [Streptomyces sp. ATE26]MDI1458720.1 hypothetical protein [Streptomyces sp. ATE26]